MMVVCVLFLCRKRFEGVITTLSSNPRSYASKNVPPSPVRQPDSLYVLQEHIRMGS